MYFKKRAMLEKGSLVQKNKLSKMLNINRILAFCQKLLSENTTEQK